MLDVNYVRLSADTHPVVGDGSELQLVADIKLGDESAFAALFDLHVQQVYRYCSRRSDSEAEDLTSVVFLEAWRLRDRAVVVDGSLRPWLLAIAHNVVRNANRAQRRHRAALARLHALPAPEVDDPAAGVAARLDAPSDGAAIAAAISDLTPKQRDVVELCLVEGMTPASASLVLGLPEGTVKSRLADARRRLRSLLHSSEFAAWADPPGDSGHQSGERREGASAGKAAASWTP